jgi:hypothetical protein
VNDKTTKLSSRAYISATTRKRVIAKKSSVEFFFLGGGGGGLPFIGRLAGILNSKR